MSHQLCSSDCPFAKGIPTCVGVKCVAYTKAREALERYFKFPNFRPGQLEALLPLLHQRDVFVRMATGSGKSLCMFLGPLAVSDKAIGVVISPLRALMNQQVKQLNDLGASAIQIDNSTKFTDVATGCFRFVFMSPEVAVVPPWRNIFKSPVFRSNLCLVAVDEAHCITEWGNDFRAAFRKIGGLRALTVAPFVALSASATEQMIDAIKESLQLKDPVVVSRSLDRPNVFISASKSVGVDRDFGSLASLLSTCDDLLDVPKTIIYCPTKDAVCSVYSFLKKTVKHKQSVSVYHASLSDSLKAFNASTFCSTSSELRCLVATVAFGMGIDIPDIEIVVLNGLPSSVSELYQMIGRAGRNGSPSRAHLLFKAKDIDSVDVHLKSVCTGNCRRSTILSGVGNNDHIMCTATNCCDVCTWGNIPYPRLDILQCASRPRSKRSCEVREVDNRMKEQVKMVLLEEREKIIKENPGYIMMGKNYVYSDYLIDTIVEKSDSIRSPEDLQHLCLRPEYCNRVFSKFWNIICAAPQTRKHCRKHFCLV